MKKINVFLLLLGPLLWAAGAAAEESEEPLQVEGYVRETLPGSTVAAAYLVLHNPGDEARRLQAVELPGRGESSAELHTTVHEGGVSRMRPLASVEVPAGGSLRMAPGAVHLMIHGVRLRAGEMLPLRLHFADGRVVEISLPVRKPQPAGGGHHHHSG